MNSITKRWIKGSLLIIFALLVLAEGFLVMSVRNTYYSAAGTALMNRVNTINGTLTASGKMSPGEKEQLLFKITSEFGEKDKFELMMLGSDGQLLATSSGFRPSGNQYIEDFSVALGANDGMYTTTYRTPMNERVMSVTAVLSQPAKEICAVRIVSSLSRVDEELNIVFAFSALVVLAILAFSITSGLFFVRSIVMPIQNIKNSTDKISKGEFDVRIENKYNDEMGELCNSINNMAQELARNDEIKNEFISSVSHELRTPLTAIKGWAETMGTTQDVQTLQKGTEIILGETERLYTMVENLLDFSRVQNANLVLTKEKLDLVAEVGEAAIMFTPQAAKQNIEIYFQEPNYIIPVMADKSRIKQVMVNLLDNALKYSQAGSVIEINLSASLRKNTATVEIKDYGKGIHPDDLEKVKQKFYKGKGAKRGSGIGLALVTEIIKQHGGTFDIESEYGKYTSMKFTLNTVRTMKGK